MPAYDYMDVVGKAKQEPEPRRVSSKSQISTMTSFTGFLPARQRRVYGTA
ncbi:MAG: hypothetical protein ABGY08_13920 [Gammaproteobacteria bacterium]|jgi:hypothetical protein